MTTLREATQQALEALEDMLGWQSLAPQTIQESAKGRAYALRAALAEPVQEPVAWMVYTLDGKSVCVTDNPADFTEQHKALPLYAAPPQRKPLTEEEALDIARTFGAQPWPPGSCVAFARAIEQAHGIKDA